MLKGFLREALYTAQHYYHTIALIILWYSLTNFLSCRLWLLEFSGLLNNINSNYIAFN